MTVNVDAETGEVFDGPQPGPVERGPRPFTQFLLEQRRGATHAELSESLQQLVLACVEHQKVGTLTYQIKVKPAGDGETVSVIDDIVMKAPKAQRSAATFFVTDDGDLSRSNPNQPELPLRRVADEPGEIRKVV